MARTIAEIKESIAADFMRNSDVARAYGFEAGAAFTSHFSRVSIESLAVLYRCLRYVGSGVPVRSAQNGCGEAYRRDTASPPEMVQR